LTIPFSSPVHNWQNAFQQGVDIFSKTFWKMKRFLKNHQFNSLLLRIWWRCKHFEYKLQARAYEEKFEDTKGVIKTVNWRWSDTRVAKRYQRGNQTVNWRWTDNAMAKRYQRGNQSGTLKMDRQYNDQKIPKR
jgi:hypothetical protein